MKTSARDRIEEHQVVLSTSQRSVLSSHRASPESGHQNTALLTRFNAGIDAQKLKAAFERVVDRIKILRLQISISNSGTIANQLEHTTEIVKTSEADFVAWCTQKAQDPIDLSVSCWESRLCMHADRTLSWYLNLHHVISDATSASLVLDQVEAEYQGEALPADDYYDVFEDSANETALAFWAKRNAALRIDRLYQPLSRQSARSETTCITWDQDLEHAWNDGFSGPYKLLLPAVSQTAFLVVSTAQYLHRLSGVEDMAIGIVVNHRSKSQARNLIGPAFGLYPVDVRIRRGDTHRSLFDKTAKAIFVNLRHAQPRAVPEQDFDAVVNTLNENVSRSQFAQIDCRVSWLKSQSIDKNHALRVLTAPYQSLDQNEHSRPSGAPELTLEFNATGLGDVTADRAANHMRTVMLAALKTPDAPIELLSLADQQEALQADQLGTAKNARQSQDLKSWLRKRLEGNSQIVLSHGAEDVTGDELWRWAVAVAVGITSKNRSQLPIRVGVTLQPSIEAVVAIYGCVLAGASFVPLDTEQPEKRIDLLKKRAGVVQTLGSVTEIRNKRPTTDAIALELTDAATADEAYLLFTSGSTGEPKGVPISVSGISAYLHHSTARYFSGLEIPVAPLLGALTFDATLTTLFGVPLSGGRLLINSGSAARALSAISRENRINWMKLTPSQIELLFRQDPDLPDLKRIVVGGEALTARLARKIAKICPDVEIVNEYGPTETVVGCMEYVIQDSDLSGTQDVPIGRPIPGVTLQVVDPMGQQLPQGAAGELWVATSGMMEDYLDGDATPFGWVSGKKYFYTGDLVRLALDGNFQFLGRIDNQLKIDGIRLDPSEIEAVAMSHPLVDQAVARVWTPQKHAVHQHCTVCGLPDNVPGVKYDTAGRCATCVAYDEVRDTAETWFKTPVILKETLHPESNGTKSQHGCVHLLSGGKDSTYALYKLVEMGANPIAFTLDNGYISESAKENIDCVVAHLGVPHEYLRPKNMKEIFVESLQRHSNVCNGCYKSLYVMATARAEALGIPFIVTGLSRGQLFETRLIPEQFRADKFDPKSIDAAVLAARRAYHSANDACSALDEAAVFADGDVFEQINYIDFYRYIDVSLSEVLHFLDAETPWLRPNDTGRSTNCLINDAGIYTHLAEQGYHNYAIPYAWDVRLGHRTRDEAIEELNDEIDEASVQGILNVLGYEVSPRRILSLWYTTRDHDVALPDLQAHLSAQLPRHAIPHAYSQVSHIPLNVSGKIDAFALPPPVRALKPRTDFAISPADPLEAKIIALWERKLNVAPISRTDDFFLLGGDSLAAIGIVVALEADLDIRLPDGLVFSARTPIELALAIQLEQANSKDESTVEGNPEPEIWTPQNPPPFTAAEAALLFEHKKNANENGLNVGRLFWVETSLDLSKFEDALNTVAARNVSLCWTYGSPRRLIAASDLVDFRSIKGALTDEEIRERCEQILSEPFDLKAGPLLRVCIQSAGDNRSAILIATHHVASDHEGFAAIFEQVFAAYNGQTSDAKVELDAPTFIGGLRDESDVKARSYWREKQFRESGQLLPMDVPKLIERDRLIELELPIAAQELRQQNAQPLAVRACLAANVAMRCLVSGGPVTLGLLTTPRHAKGGSGIVAHLLNPLPFQFDLDFELSLMSGLKQVGDTVSEALAKPYLHLAEIVEARAAANLTTPAPQAFVSLTDNTPLSVNDIKSEQEPVHVPWAITPVTFFVTTQTDKVTLLLEYDRSLYSDTAAHQLLARFRDVLMACQLPDARPLKLIAPVTPSFSRGPDLAPGPLLLEMVFNHLNDDLAEQPAVICCERITSRKDLRASIRTIVLGLKAQGVVAGDRVAILLPRCANYVASILAIQSMRAAYVPLDFADRLGRNAHVLDVADVRVTICSDHARMPNHKVLHLTEDGIAGSSWAGSDALSIPHIEASDIAYVVFTSGTTGRPKGVPIDHGQLAQSNHARSIAYADAPSCFLLASNFAYDSSIVGLFWTLMHGGVLVLPSDEEARAPDALASLMSRSMASHVLLVPTLYATLLTERVRQNLGSWPNHVILAGEDFSHALVQRHFKLTPKGGQLTNEYGPSEATVWSLFHHLEAEEELVFAGRPVAGTWAGIVDKDGMPIPDGTVGELVLGGPLITRGYLSPSDTENSFGSDEVFGRSADRTYHTGDLAIMNNGVVRLLGRKDEQLNIGGLRVAASEIAAPLSVGQGVADFAVIAVDSRNLNHLMTYASKADLQRAFAESADDENPTSRLEDILRASTPGNVEIVAHVAGDDLLSETAMRDLAKATLPPFLRPSRYVFHTQLPTNPSGKIDTVSLRELSNLKTARPRKIAVPAGPAKGVGSSQMQKDLNRLTSLFAETLRSSGFGPHNDFFEFGGHSLLALQLVLRIEEVFDTTLSTGAIYEAPSPAGLLRHLSLQHTFAVQEPTAAMSAPAQTSSDKHSLVFPLQTNGTRPPIIALHSLGENAAIMRPISKALGPDQPFWCVGELTDRDIFGGWVNDPSEPSRVADVAARYVSEIGRLIPSGPVVLLGNCLGAVYAYEVAQQMSAQGRHPFLLVMIDDLHAPETLLPEKEADLFYFLRSSVNLIRQRGVQNFITNPLRIIRATTGIVLRLKNELTRKYEIIALARARSSGQVLSRRLKVRDFIEQTFSSVQNYKYLPYDGPVAIVRQRNNKSYPDLSLNNAWGNRLSDVKIERVAHSFEDRMLAAASQAQAITTRINELLGGHDVTSVEADCSKLVAPKRMQKFARVSDDYSISVQLQNDTFIGSPRPEQRQWLVSERTRELGLELEHLHQMAPQMGEANGSLEIGGRDVADLTPENLMEDWQIPLMRAMARIAAVKGGDVLEIGYGRGVSAEMISEFEPRSHTILDCNPHVLKAADVWRQCQPNRKIHLVDGLWQDVVGDMDQFDGILFHTYPLSTEELSEALAEYSTFAEVFFPHAARLLRPGGRFTYFVAEADSLSRAHQRALLTHFSSFKIGQVHNLEIPKNSPDAHWYDRIVTVEAIA